MTTKRASVRKRQPARETAIISPGIIVCGFKVEPSAKPVSMKSRHHPGFGWVALLRNGTAVECCSRFNSHAIGEGDFDAQPTLQHYENRAKKNPNARWTLRVSGPMSGYVLGRKRGQWFVIESRDGFA